MKPSLCCETIVC